MRRTAALLLVAASCAPTSQRVETVRSTTTTMRRDAAPEVTDTQVGDVLLGAERWEAERRRVERAARSRARAIRPSAATPAAAPPANGDGCGGWRDLVARHFRPADIGRACRILLCESGGDPNATSPSGRHRGLMQIVMGSYDPEANVAHAAQMAYTTASGWGHWTCR